MPFFFLSVPVGGGRKGRYQYCNTAHGSARILQYRVTIYPNTENAVTNGEKWTLPILQIPYSNRNNTFMSVFQNQGASMSSVR